MLPDDGQTPVSTSPILAVPLCRWNFRIWIIRLGGTTTSWKFWIVGLANFRCSPGGWMISSVKGDALGTCTSDEEVLVDGEGWLCLLFFPRSGKSGNNSVATRLMCHGLAHSRSFAWDPGPGAGQCIHVCCDCICVITLFRMVMLSVHDWAVCSTKIGSGIGIAGQMPAKLEV